MTAIGGVKGWWGRGGGVKETICTFYWFGQMERLSTAMQITGIGNSSLGLILALKILPFSPTHPTLGVALKKLIGKFFFSSFGLSQGTSRPPPVTLGETPKKKTTCGGAERAQRYV